MIINGDWSWADYLATPGIDAAVAVLPIVSATGQPMRTMFAPKGYSLNVNTRPETAATTTQMRQIIGRLVIRPRSQIEVTRRFPFWPCYPTGLEPLAFAPS